MKVFKGSEIVEEWLCGDSDGVPVLEDERFVRLDDLLAVNAFVALPDDDECPLQQCRIGCYVLVNGCVCWHFGGDMSQNVGFIRLVMSGERQEIPLGTMVKRVRVVSLHEVVGDVGIKG